MGLADFVMYKTDCFAAAYRSGVFKEYSEVISAPGGWFSSVFSPLVVFDRAGLGKAWRSPSALAGVARLLRQLRRGQFDWALDLQGLLRSGIFAAATRADEAACPDLEGNAALLDLLDGARIGVTITDQCQMDPEYSTSALVAWHPQARYFTV